MIREAGPLLPSTVLISLDHDLEPEPGGSDPGDGYMVAQWLVSQPIVRPVIVHSSNGARSTWMAGAFDVEGWRHYRVSPLGDDWVESMAADRTTPAETGAAGQFWFVKPCKCGSPPESVSGGQNRIRRQQ